MQHADVKAAKAALATAQSQLDDYQRQVRRRGWLGLPASVLRHLGRLEERVARRSAELKRAEARTRQGVVQ